MAVPYITFLYHTDLLKSVGVVFKRERQDMSKIGQAKEKKIIFSFFIPDKIFKTFPNQKTVQGKERDHQRSTPPPLSLQRHAN